MHFLPAVYVAVFLRQIQSVCGQQLRRIIGNGRRRSQPGRANARHIQEMRRRKINNKIIHGGIGPHTGKVADILAKIHAGHRAHRFLAHLSQARCGVRCIVRVPAHHCIGSYDQIAVHRRRHQHALALFTRALEDHRRHPVALALVQQVILAYRRLYGKGRRRHQVVHPIGVHAGSVDHIPCLHCVFAVGQGIALRCLFNLLHREPTAQFTTVLHRHLGHSQTKLPRINNGCRRRPQSTLGCLRYIGLLGSHLRSVPKLQPRHTVLAPPLQQVLQGIHVFIVQGHHQGAGVFPRHMELFANLSAHGIAFYIQLGHQRARVRIVPGVHNGTVGAGGTHTDVVLLLQQNDPHPAARQPISTGTPGNTAADDRYIIHLYIPLILAKQAKK